MAASKKPTKSKSDIESGLESAFATRTADLEKGTRAYELQLKVLEKQLRIQEDIAKQISINKSLTGEQKDILSEAQKKYVEHQKLQADLAQQVKDRTKSEEEARKILNKSRAEYDSIVRSAKLTGKETAELKNQLKGVSREMRLSADAFDKTAKKAGLLNAAIDQLGSSGIPLLREMGDVLKNVIEKNALGAKMALTALGAAAAIFADKYYNADAYAGIKADLDAQANIIDAKIEQGKLDNKHGFINARRNLEINAADIEAANRVANIDSKALHLKQTIGMSVAQNSIDTANTVNQLTIEAANASKRAAIQFSSQMQSSAAEFSAASKTALYGKGIGSIGYGAAQMQLAGVGAENVAASLTTATKALGSKVSSEVAADMAVLEKRTGQSSENISSMVSFFKRTSKVSAGTALNMVEGMRAMADSANIDLGGLMEEVAQSSKEALGYQIKSGPALAKQVAYAQSLGVNFQDIAKAGKNMVLNYKDSIQNEMELSAMLGKNVNLSEARSLFMQGKTDDALKSIQAQGLDPTTMNMFQQEALSKALGGMDLDALQKVATGTGKTATLGQGNVKTGNKGFLSATQSAQSTLAAQQASISAQTAIVDAKLSGEITKAYLNSPGYLEYQKNLLQQEKNQTELDKKIQQSYLASDGYFQYQQALLAQQKKEIALVTEENNKYIKSQRGLADAAEKARFELSRPFTENARTAGAGVLGAGAGYLTGKIFETIWSKANPMPVTVVDGGGSFLDNLLGNKKRKPGRPPKTKVGKIKQFAEKGLDAVKDFFTKKTSSKLIAKESSKVAAKQATKQIEKVAAKSVVKSVAKTTGKALGKSLLKKIPFIGLGAGLFFAAQRAMAGDYAGAALEASSGAASMIPGGGTAASIAIDAALAARDLKQAGVFDSKAPGSTVVNGKVVPKGASPSKVSTPANTRPTMTLTDEQYQTRLQEKMVEYLATSATLLQYILLESEDKQYTTLNGMKLNQQLLATMRKEYAVNRNEKVGAYKGMR